MKAKIEINMDNAAFEDPTDGELGRILHDLADKIAYSIPNYSINLRDVNGNTVGVFKIIGNKKED